MSAEQVLRFDPASHGGMDVDHPLIKRRLTEERTVFAKGARIRMNIVPMFLNVFIPWAVFVLAVGVCSFSMLYRYPALAAVLLLGIFVLWLVTMGIAVWARKKSPEPTWYTYLAVMVGLFALTGAVYGKSIFDNYTKQYYELTDLKLSRNVEASKERGSNMVDTGIVYFADGNHVDGLMASHFKVGTTYCVAPVVGPSGVSETQSYDFWVVGTNCCSVGASDFRCGSWTSGQAPSGVRIVDDAVLPYYRLAVQQAETTYNIMAKHPIFFEWAQDPLLTLAIYNRRAFRSFLFANAVAFIVSCFCMVLISVRFSCIGRGRTDYVMNDEYGFPYDPLKQAAYANGYGYNSPYSGSAGYGMQGYAF